MKAFLYAEYAAAGTIAVVGALIGRALDTAAALARISALTIAPPLRSASLRRASLASSKSHRAMSCSSFAA